MLILYYSFLFDTAHSKSKSYLFSINLVSLLSLQVDSIKLHDVMKSYDDSQNVFWEQLPRREKEVVALMDIVRVPVGEGEEEVFDVWLGLSLLFSFHKISEVPATAVQEPRPCVMLSYISHLSSKFQSWCDVIVKVIMYPYVTVYSIQSISIQYTVF